MEKNAKSIAAGKLDFRFCFFQDCGLGYLSVFVCSRLFSIRNQKVVKHTAFLLVCVEKSNCVVYWFYFIASIFLKYIFSLFAMTLYYKQNTKLAC